MSFELGGTHRTLIIMSDKVPNPSPPISLAIETATSVCAVAVMMGRNFIGELISRTDRRHNETLPVLVEQVLRECEVVADDLKFISLSIGPGSFTGLRVGSSYAKGMSTALGIPIIPVDTMAGLVETVADTALSPFGDTILSPLIIARRGEVFASTWKISGGGPERLKPTHLADRALVESLIQEGSILIGEGARWLGFAPAWEIEASAWSIGSLGWDLFDRGGSLIRPAELEPHYLKEFTVGGGTKRGGNE